MKVWETAGAAQSVEMMIVSGIVIDERMCLCGHGLELAHLFYLSL